MLSNLTVLYVKYHNYKNSLIKSRYKYFLCTPAKYDRSSPKKPKHLIRILIGYFIINYNKLFIRLLIFSIHFPCKLV